MEIATKHRSHSAAFQRRVAGKVIIRETLRTLMQRHAIARQLIRVQAMKCEAAAAAC